MRRGLLCAVAVAALLGLGAGRTAADVPRNAPESLPPAVEELKAAAEAYDARDCAKTLRLARPLVDAPKNSDLPDELAAIGYEIVVSCELDANDLEHAWPHAVRGTALPHASDDLWRWRFAIELDSKRDDAALATLEAMAHGHGSALDTVPTKWIWDLNSRLDGAEAKPSKRRLLKAMVGSSYRPPDPFQTTDLFRLEYARLLAGEDSAEAARLVRGLQDPDSILEASLDLRFHALFPSDPDVRSAMERRLAADRVGSSAHPDLLEGYVSVATDLRLLGRPAEALQALDPALAKVGDAKAFTDRDDQLNWFWDARARALSKLGRIDDAIDAFRKGDAAGKGDSVSQAINLAELQDRFGRGEDALKTLSVFDDPKRQASPYGWMEMRLARFCAYVIAGRAKEGAADLDYARTHEKDHPEALFDMLLCSGDMDGAATALIRRLDDPERRVGALRQLSDYDDPPVKLPPDPLEGRIPELKTRPDVKAAIAKAGGTRRFNIQRGDL